MDGEAESRWLGTSPCDNKLTIALRANVLRAFEGKSSALIPPGPRSRVGTVQIISTRGLSIFSEISTQLNGHLICPTDACKYWVCSTKVPAGLQSHATLPISGLRYTSYNQQNVCFSSPSILADFVTLIPRTPPFCHMLLVHSDQEHNIVAMHNVSSAHARK